jgi:hypothetical protein
MNQLIFHLMSRGNCNVQSINQLTGTVEQLTVRLWRKQLMNQLTGNWKISWTVRRMTIAPQLLVLILKVKNIINKL